MQKLYLKNQSSYVTINMYSFRFALGRWFESNHCLVTGIVLVISLFYAYEYVSRKGDANMYTCCILAVINTIANLSLNFVAQSEEQGLI